MPNSDGKTRLQLQIIQEGVDDAWFFESQSNLPRLGEYVTLFDEDGETVIEGRVVDVRWAYIEENNDASCTITLRAESQ